VRSVDDLAAVESPPPMIRQLRDEGMRSILSVPLLVDAEAIGEVNLASSAPHGFTAEHRDIAMEIAAPLAIAIQQARLRGYAIRFDERFAGVCSVAAPVMHKDKGIIAAINIAGPSSRLPAGKLEQLSLELINAAGRLSESLDRL